MCYLKKFKIYKKRLLMIAEHLENNTFYLNANNFRSYFVKNVSVSLPCDRINLKTRLKWTLFGLHKHVNKNQENTGFGGQIVYFNNTSLNPSNAKIFNIKNKKILTVFFDQKSYDEVKKKSMIASSFYPTIKKEFNDEKLCYTEEFLSCFGTDNLNDEAIIKLFNFYKKIFTCKENCKKINFENLYLQHGDLSLDNFSYNKNTQELIFIDFDWIEYYPKFYDIFFLIYNSAYYGNTYFLDSFNNGKYDIFFENENMVNLLCNFGCAISLRTHLYDDMIKNSIEKIGERL